MSLLGILDKAGDLLGLGATAATSAYTGSFLESAIDLGTTVYKGVQGFLDTPLGNAAAGAVLNKQLGGARQSLPKANRMNVNLGNTAQAQFKASQTDMGYTSKVMEKLARAQQAPAGTPVHTAINRIQSRAKRGTTIGLDQAIVNVAPRAKNTQVS